MNGPRWIVVGLLVAFASIVTASPPEHPAPADKRPVSAVGADPQKTETRTDSKGNDRGAHCPRVKPSDELVVLSDKNGSTAERIAALARLEQCASRGSMPAQDFVGSIYWMGDSLPHALVRTNLAKARLYLSNAAAQGQVIAMAKLAEIELAAGNTDSAMVWAQLFAHYQALMPGSTAPGRGYLAELLQRIYLHFNRAHLPSVTQDANAFVASYDTAIRSSALRNTQNSSKIARMLDPHAPHTVMFSPVTQPDMPYSCYSEYLIAFNNDGSTYGTWMLDAMPTTGCGSRLREIAMHARAAPDRDTSPGVRLILQPIVFQDQRYHLDQRQGGTG